MFVIIFEIIVMFILRISCGISVIVRLEIVWFRNKFFKVVGMDDVFYSVWIIRRFLRVVIKENVKFKVLKINMNVLWKCISVLYFFNLKL